MRVCALGFLAVAACAAHTEVRSIHRQVASLKQRNVEQGRKLDELENRLFLMEDRLDTARVARERAHAPELPIVKLSPPATPLRVDAQDAEPEMTVHEEPTSETESATEIVYEGDAVDDGTAVVHLSGTGERLETGSRRATPKAASVSKRLPVVSLPDSQVRLDTELGLYRQAQNAIHRGKHDEAALLFEKFTALHPTHEYADNALYWLAECHYALGRFEAALDAFRDVVKKYPDGNKVPDALLKVGYSLLSLGQPDLARQALEEVERSFPKSAVASLARRKIEELVP